jgi:hypothetical protein
MNLEQLNEAFPETGMLTRAQVAEFIGCDVRTVSRNIKMNQTTGRISKADLARQICAG